MKNNKEDITKEATESKNALEAYFEKRYAPKKEEKKEMDKFLEKEAQQK